MEMFMMLRNMCTLTYLHAYIYIAESPVAQMAESACKAGDLSSIPRSGRSPAEGNGNPLQYSRLENPRDRGPWRAVVHGVARSHT